MYFSFRLIRDPDPIVVVNCLSTLEEILNTEGGIVINRNIAHYLLSKLDTFSDWNLVTVLTTLKKYRPRNEKETLDIMNMADPYLKYNSFAVVISALRYFLYLVQHMPQLHGDVFTRAKSPILQNLGSGNPELTFTLLEFIDSILKESKDVFQPHYQALYSKYNEPIFVKVKKIEMLPKLVSEANFNEILDELSMHCIEINSEVAHAAVSSISYVSAVHHHSHDVCLDKLLELLDMRLDYVANEILEALEKANLKNYSKLEKAMGIIQQSLDLNLNSSGKCAGICLIGEHGECLDESPFIFEDYIMNCDDLDTSVKRSLLTAAIKLFLKRPAECQDLMGKVFEMCLACDDKDLLDRSNYYYSLLKCDANLAQTVILGSAGEVKYQ